MRRLPRPWCDCRRLNDWIGLARGFAGYAGMSHTTCLPTEQGRQAVRIFHTFGSLSGADDDTGPVKEAVAALSEPARELVILRYYNDLSYEQISEVLGISRAAINGRLTRAKRKLAAHLKRHGYPETSK